MVDTLLAVSQPSHTDTLKRLDQGRLNVDSKSRVNPFAWRGQFTPQFVDYLLEVFAEPCSYVLDPFSGSGTLLLESANHGISCLGNELNPAAYFMSKFFHLVNMERSARAEIFHNLHERISKLVCRYDGLPLLRPEKDYRTRYSNLLSFAKDFLPTNVSADSMTLCCAMNLLFRAESSKSRWLGDSIWSSFDYLSSFASRLPVSYLPINARLGDARAIHTALDRHVDINHHESSLY